MSKWPMRGHFRYLRFKTFPTTPRTPQCEVFWTFLFSSEHSGVPEDSKSPTFPSVGLHPHTCPKWGCDNVSYVKGQTMLIKCWFAIIIMVNTIYSISIWNSFKFMLAFGTVHHVLLQHLDFYSNHATFFPT
jgi:hypothetical protein